MEAAFNVENHKSCGEFRNKTAYYTYFGLRTEKNQIIPVQYLSIRSSFNSFIKTTFNFWTERLHARNYSFKSIVP